MSVRAFGVVSSSPQLLFHLHRTKLLLKLHLKGFIELVVCNAFKLFNVVALGDFGELGGTHQLIFNPLKLLIFHLIFPNYVMFSLRLDNLIDRYLNLLNGYSLLKIFLSDPWEIDPFTIAQLVHNLLGPFLDLHSRPIPRLRMIPRRNMSQNL